MTCDFFCILGSLVVPHVDHLDVNNIILYYTCSVPVPPLHTVKSWCIIPKVFLRKRYRCVTPKVFSRKSYNLMQRAVQIILQKKGLQNIGIRNLVNKSPTRCSLFHFVIFALHVSDTVRVHHQEWYAKTVEAATIVCKCVWYVSVESG